MGSRLLGIDADGDVVAADAVAFPAEFDNGNETGTFALDWNNGQKQRATLTGNITTLNITAPSVGGAGNFMLKLIQDGTGGRTVTWPASVRWSGGTAPTLSTGAGAIDLIGFYWDGTNYYGFFGLNFS